MVTKGQPCLSSQRQCISSESAWFQAPGSMPGKSSLRSQYQQALTSNFHTKREQAQNKHKKNGSVANGPEAQEWSLFCNFFVSQQNSFHKQLIHLQTN